MPKLDNIPSCPPVPKPQPPEERQTFVIELLTPLFGGGVETRTNDRDFPIRPTSIRGQLQFWWRATVGAQYENLKDLRAAQSEVWGSTDKASPVQIRVELTKVGDPQSCATYQKDGYQFKSMPNWNAPFQKTSLPYALFPFQGQLGPGRTSIEVPPADCIQTASFQLTLRCPPGMWQQVEPAVWAWVNFGGLGSRTRRGCGALYCEQFASADAADLAAKWKNYMPELFPQREWPTLALTMLLKPQAVQPLVAWDQVIDRFRHFRQGVNLGRNPGSKPNRPGRSRFPEPESIRRLTRQRSSEHQRMDNIPDDAFPRAELGLPIVFQFHFNDERQGDPQKTTLNPRKDAKGNERERMSSPLILKPLALKGGKQAVPLVLRLLTPPLDAVELYKGKTSLGAFGPTAIRDPRLARSPNSPLSGSPNGSALEAFVALVRGEGYTEVKR